MYFFSYEVNGDYIGDFQIGDEDFDVLLSSLTSDIAQGNLTEMMSNKLEENSVFTDDKLVSA